MFNLGLEKMLTIFKEKINEKSFNEEDKKILLFFNSLVKNKQYKYLEVGSGEGRFPFLIEKLYTNFKIECLEINQDLAKATISSGLATTIGDISKMPYNDESFDIVHCSHVIEHLGYPEISFALNHLIRVVKINGYVIIRSPLWHKGFYLDIDHIRPYPPETILNFFKNRQQQKTGVGNFEVVNLWYRRGQLKIYNIGLSKVKYYTNGLLALLYSYFKFPFSNKNGYILILKKSR
ncbi:class I SAM-dependent methyltransferase [Patescibacteria group bacterium]|nr:class I SAM-dependent methyltransferase [Patescibacteria group bacterium]